MTWPTCARHGTRLAKVLPTGFWCPRCQVDQEVGRLAVLRCAVDLLGRRPGDAAPRLLRTLPSPRAGGAALVEYAERGWVDLVLRVAT